MEGNLFNKIIQHKALFVVLGLVILAELVWAGWIVFKPTKPEVTTRPPDAVTMAKPTSVSLTAAQSSIKIGEKLTVSINISSGDKLTDGTDIVLNFDPNLLSVATLSAGPVNPGPLYNEYPFNKLEEGNITVSGIAPASKGVVANGLFGTVEFTAKKAGLAKLNLLYTKDSTNDTNVIETGSGRDILEKVENLEIKILP